MRMSGVLRLCDQNESRKGAFLQPQPHTHKVDEQKRNNVPE